MTLQEIADEAGLSKKLLQGRMRRGMTMREAIDEGHPRCGKSCAKKYPYKGRMLTLTEVSKETGINGDTLRGRVERGCTLEQAVDRGAPLPRDTSAKEYLFRGVMMTIKQLSEIGDVHPYTIRKRIELGWSAERAATEPADGRFSRNKKPKEEPAPAAKDIRPASRAELAAKALGKLIQSAKEGDLTHSRDMKRFELKSEYLTYAATFEGDLVILSATYNESGLRSDLRRAWRVGLYGLGEAFVGNARGEWERVY